VTIVGLGLYSYYVRELMAALTLFSVAFFSLALVGLVAFLVWSASVQVAIWARPASQSLFAFSRRLLAAYTPDFEPRRRLRTEYATVHK
jgi:hypothetical protein